MKDFNLKKYLAENKLVKENANDGSQYHIDQIDDDLMNGDFENEEDIDGYLDNIIAGIEELRAMYKGNMNDEYEAELDRKRFEDR